ncbi:MAG: metallophosphoesterase [Lachnospiraceae bacterium]|nr:metallophosphoesterase [Lachnospiraceae bacterium]
MIFFLLSPLFLAAHVYFVYECFKWLDTLRLPRGLRRFVKILAAFLWAVFSLSIFAAFVIPAGVTYESSPVLYTLRRVLKKSGNYNLGVLIYMGMSFAVILIGRLVAFLWFKRKGYEPKQVFSAALYQNKRAVMGVLNIVFIILLMWYGVAHGRDVKLNTYEIETAKQVEGSDGLRIALVADMHLGYNIGCAQMEKMADLINASSPDIVIIAGDIFDNEYEALDDPERLTEIFASIKSRYGTYAVYGNHDIEEKIIGGFTFNYSDPNKAAGKEMNEFLQKAGITLLLDDHALIDDTFYVYGRPDYSKPGNGTGTRKSARELVQGLDLTKPLIVIDHQPKELQELADAGVDIDLCGHTHDGQFFPMNITSRLFTWENSAGILKKGNMYNIVTSGVGLYGPNIRIGTDAEVCIIDVKW